MMRLEEVIFIFIFLLQPILNLMVKNMGTGFLL